MLWWKLYFCHHSVAYFLFYLFIIQLFPFYLILKLNTFILFKISVQNHFSSNIHQDFDNALALCLPNLSHIHQDFDNHSSLALYLGFRILVILPNNRLEIQVHLLWHVLSSEFFNLYCCVFEHVLYDKGEKMSALKFCSWTSFSSVAFWFFLYKQRQLINFSFCKCNKYLGTVDWVKR